MGMCHLKLIAAGPARFLRLYQASAIQHPTQHLNVLSLVIERNVPPYDTEADLLSALAAQGSLQCLKILSIEDRGRTGETKEPLNPFLGTAPSEAKVNILACNMLFLCWPWCCACISHAWKSS